MVGGSLDASYPKVGIALQANLGARRNSSTLVGPGASYSWRSVDSNLASGTESVVRSVGVTDECRVVGVVADTAAGHGVGIAVDNTGC